MIQAGTMSSGSSRTCGVVGAYWISSISSLRNTTVPLVSAMFSPILKCSSPFNCSARQPNKILGQQRCAGNEISAAYPPGGFQNGWVGPGKVDRRQRVQHETAEQVDAFRVMARHAGDVTGGCMPLRFSGQLSLSQEVEGRTLPAGVTEAAIAGIWFTIADRCITRRRRTIER